MTQRRIVAYLDQSDISYLATGRGPSGTDYVRLRDRLQRLSEDGALRVRTSFAHLTESLPLRRRSRRAIMELLRSLRDATFVCNFPGEFWQAELDRRAPEIREARIATVEPLFWAPFLLFALLGRPCAELEARLRQGLRREVKRGLPELDERFIRLVLQDEAPKLLDLTQETAPGTALRYWLSLRYHRGLRKAFERRGFDYPHGGIKAYRQGTHGFGQLDPLVRSQVSARALRAEEMPALALSTAIKRSIGMDLGRSDLRSDDHDAWHVTYSAYCDVATADRRVLDATKQARRSLRSPRWYPTGRLQELVDDVEAGAILPPCRGSP